MRRPHRQLVASFSVVVALVLVLGTAPTVAAQPTPHQATLPNGLKVVILRSPLAPVVTTQMNYRVGSIEAPPGVPGMAHAQEHMLFRGSPGLSAAQLANIMAGMGGDFNGATQQTVTQYLLNVPARHLDVALRIEATRMRAVLDAQPLWEKERGAIEQEVAMDLSNPRYVFFEKLLAAMFPGTPYEHDALGTRESFAQTTGTMLRAFHRAWYAPNNAVLVIAGDVDPEPTLALVRRLFGGIPARPLPPRPSFTLPPQQPATIQFETNLAYGLAAVAYRLPGFESPDYATGIVLGDVLDSKRGNLYALVPEGKALNTSFEGVALPKASVVYARAEFPAGADGAALVSRIKQIVADYVANGVPADLVEAAKRRELAEDQFRRASIAGLADDWSQALAVEGRTSPDDDLQAVQRVTVADVNRVARQYLINDTAIVGLLTPRGGGAPTTTATPGGTGKESFAPQATKPVPLPAWARKVEQVPPVPDSHIHPTVFDLPNGLHVIVQPETISQTVTVLGRVKSEPDLETPPGKEGVDDILNALFAYGSTTRDRLAFQEALDAIAASVSAGRQFSLQVVADQFETGMDLLADNLLHPALPASAFPVVQDEIKGAVAGQLQSPEYRARRALRLRLYPADDPLLRQPTPETVGALTVADVEAYYHTVFRPDLTTLVIVGRVTPEQARAVVEKTFGAWQATGSPPPTDLPPVPPNAPAVTAVPDPSSVQTEVRLAETLGLTRTHPDYYALNLGNHVLSGALYATRLVHDLREDAGLVYDVESRFQIRKTRGLFLVLYGCDPPNVAKARALIERDLRQMQQTPVSPAELRRAQTLLLQQIPLAEAGLDDIAALLLSLVEQELPLDEPLRAARQYRSLSAKDVQAAYGRWIRPQGFVQVTREPSAQ
jgi:zinc protease